MSSSRALRDEECELIRFLLSSIGAKVDKERATSRVVDMQDGQMGSIRFVEAKPPLGKTLVEAQYRDSDGVLVSITVNADSDDRLFEIDFWKVDFSSLKQYPRPKDLFAVTRLTASR